jgi:acyl carrier protein
MNTESEIKKLLGLYYDYFQYDDFEDLDSLSKMDILTELEDVFDTNLPLSIYDTNPSERQFVKLVVEIIDGGAFK